MTEGVGLALLGGGITLAAGILKFVPARRRGGEDETLGVSQVCSAHSGVVESVGNVKESLVRIERKVDALENSQEQLLVVVTQVKTMMEDQT
jgi:L-asparaginase II